MPIDMKPRLRLRRGKTYKVIKGARSNNRGGVGRQARRKRRCLVPGASCLRAVQS